MVYQRIRYECKHNLGASFEIKNKARALRKRMTKQESIVWSKIRRRQIKGIYFRRQHPYSIYILDFFSFEAGLVIEIDGEIHLRTKEYDEERTRFLESSGLKVIRFKNREIDENLNRVIDEIKKYLE
jgi:very-short-patch-repair endonuclease